jgi:hypothetical protein
MMRFLDHNSGDPLALGDRQARGLPRGAAGVEAMDVLAQQETDEAA